MNIILKIKNVNIYINSIKEKQKYVYTNIPRSPPPNVVKWIKEHNKPAFKLTDPLCFTAEEAGSTVKMAQNEAAPTVYLETSPTGEEGTWSDFIVGSTTITLANVGDKVYFRAKYDNERFGISDFDYNYFEMRGKIAASGNLNTLLKADGSVLDLTGRDYCYSCMFQNQSSLTQAPALPATTLADYCYDYMFSSCTSLTKAPELPAMILTEGCYSDMFSSCTSLTQAPELPATTLASYCYSYMFAYCKSPFTFSDKTFDEVTELIQEQYIIGDYWYYYDEEYNEVIINPIEIVCSDKTMLASYDEYEGTWTLTEK